MALKSNLIGEVRFSCSKVTDVVTISNLVVSNASVSGHIYQHGYILPSVIRLVGLPVAKDELIGRSRFNEGIYHPASDFPFSYDKASLEIAEAHLAV